MWHLALGSSSVTSVANDQYCQRVQSTLEVPSWEGLLGKALELWGNVDSSPVIWWSFIEHLLYSRQWLGIGQFGEWLLLCLFIYFYFWVKVWPCIPGWPQTSASAPGITCMCHHARLVTAFGPHSVAGKSIPFEEDCNGLRWEHFFMYGWF